MGECLIVRRGGQAYKLPVLSENYPQDVTIVASASGSAVFSVQIAEPGNPAEYTYKWYLSGNVISGATGSSVSIGNLTSAHTTTVYCEVTNKAGTVTSRVATLTVRDWKPAYSYTGTATFIDDGNYNWRIKFLTSGTLTISDKGNANTIDVFCVGGGAGGGKTGQGASSRGSGGGGYTTTSKGIAWTVGSAAITIGAGGAMGTSGGTTTAYGVSAGGGASGTNLVGGNGGSGGGRRVL